MCSLGNFVKHRSGVPIRFRFRCSWNSWDLSHKHPNPSCLKLILSWIIHQNKSSYTNQLSSKSNTTYPDYMIKQSEKKLIDNSYQISFWREKESLWSQSLVRIAPAMQDIMLFRFFIWEREREEGAGGTTVILSSYI